MPRLGGTYHQFGVEPHDEVLHHVAGVHEWYERCTGLRGCELHGERRHCSCCGTVSRSDGPAGARATSAQLRSQVILQVRALPKHHGSSTVSASSKQVRLTVHA